MKTVTLNLPYDLSEAQWQAVDEVFQSMDGWLGYSDADRIPRWYGAENDDRFIWASVEPSGLLIEGNVEAKLWTGWISMLCARLSLRLNREVCDAEM